MPGPEHRSWCVPLPPEHAGNAFGLSFPNTLMKTTPKLGCLCCSAQCSAHDRIRLSPVPDSSCALLSPREPTKSRNPNDFQDIQLVLSIKAHKIAANAGLLQPQNSSTHIFLGVFYYGLSPLPHFHKPLAWLAESGTLEGDQRMDRGSQ